MRAVFFFACLLVACTAATQTPSYDSLWVVSVQSRVMATVNLGDFHGGNALALAALDTARARYGAESREATELMVGIGDYLLFVGDFQAAQQTIAAYLANWKKLLGERHVKVAEALHNLGYAHFRLRQYDKVMPLYEEARQLLVDLDLNPSLQLAFLFSGMASFHESQGQAPRAEEAHREALRIADQLPSDQTAEPRGILLNNLAVFYNGQQRQDEALYYIEAYINILEGIYSKRHPYYLKALTNKGFMLMEAGRYGESAQALEYALNTARDILPAGDAQLAHYLRQLGMLYERVGRNEASAQLRRESLGLLKQQYGDQHPAYVENLLELASALQRCNGLAAADSALREAVRILERDQRTGELWYAYALTSLGSLYQLQGRVAEAGPLLRQGTRLGGRFLGSNNAAFYLRFEKALIRQYLMENQPDSALLLLDAVQAPIVNSYGKTHRLYVLLETQYGKAWQLKNDAGRALEHYSAAFGALKENLAGNFRYLSADEREKFARSFEDFRDAFLAAARAFPDDTHYSAFLYDLALFQKELLASYDRQWLDAWRQQGDSVFQDYVKTRRMIARQWTLPAAQRTELPALEVRCAALEKNPAIQAAAPATLQAPRWRQVQEALAPGDAALEWLILPPAREGREKPRYAALLLRPDREGPELLLLPETDAVDALFASRGSRGLQYATRTYTGDALYRMLWQPLEGRLAGVQRIFYAPEGPLHLLNFDALPASEGVLLSDKYRLVRLTNTARLLQADFGEPVSTRGRALLAGGLDYEAAAPPAAAPSDDRLTARGAAPWRGGVREWAALPNTLPEVQRLAALLQQKQTPVVAFTGAAGNEGALKSACAANKPVLMHLATHGFFFEKNTAAPGSLGLVAAENPMLRSGLVLAGANPAWRGDAGADTADDDGILTADEISLLDLRHTALVVLSACETGLGDVRDDEGVYGLQRAFRLAGARGIVLSLWRVPDVQTREFMEKFYAAWLESGDVRGAFRDARQAMRQAYGNPYYWAGFILSE